MIPKESNYRKATCDEVKCFDCYFIGFGGPIGKDPMWCTLHPDKPQKTDRNNTCKFAKRRKNG